MRRVALCSFLIASCQSQPDPLPEPACEAGPERLGVVTQIAFARPPEPGVSDGFDLDGVATGQGEGGGCGVDDDIAPDGRTGIDNALARLLPALELTEAQAVEEIMQELINSGELLLVVGLQGVDDIEQDDCTELRIERARGVPRVGAPGTINAGQTFEPDQSSSPVDFGQAPIVDGTVEARSDTTIDLPFSFLGTDLELHLQQPAVRVELDADGSFRGLLGGGVAVADLMAVANTAQVNDEVADLLETILGPVIDLDIDGDGTCSDISITLAFRGVPAFLFEGPPGDTGG